jgi:hypothetical protein
MCSTACQGKRSLTETDLNEFGTGMINTKHSAWAITRFCRQRLQVMLFLVRIERHGETSFLIVKEIPDGHPDRGAGRLLMTGQ